MCQKSTRNGRRAHYGCIWCDLQRELRKHFKRATYFTKQRNAKLLMRIAAMLRLVIMTKARVASDMAVEEHCNTQYKCVARVRTTQTHTWTKLLSAALSNWTRAIVSNDDWLYVQIAAGSQDVMCEGVIINADDCVATWRNSSIFTTNLFFKKPKLTGWEILLSTAVTVMPAQFAVTSHTDHICWTWLQILTG